jgi:type IV secretory pathway VirB2 component (pilin)
MKIRSKLSKGTLIAVMLTTTFLASNAYADPAVTSSVADPFAATFTKLSGWTTGTAGKLITLTSFIMAGISGVAGFRPAIIFGCLGVGIVLAGSSSIVNMLFS